MKNKKRLIFILAILIALLVIVFIVNTLSGRTTIPTSSNYTINEKNNSIIAPYEYNPNISIGAMKNELVIYDGKNLIKKNDRFENVFETRLVIGDFVMKIENENIFILDKIEKILYKFNKNGEVVAQTKFMESGQNIFPLKNGDVLLSYNTNVGTDGVIAFDKDMREKINITYPNSLISAVNFEESSNHILVSAQVTNLTDITNTIYEYNSNYEVQSINSYKNLLTIDMVNTNNSRIFLDPTRLYILDGKFKNVATIDAQHSFAHMILLNDKLYLQDGDRSVMVYDKTGKLIEEKVFKDTISNLHLNMSSIVYVGITSVYTHKNTFEFAKDIEKSILLSNNNLVLFFKGNVEIIPIPY